MMRNILLITLVLSTIFYNNCQAQSYRKTDSDSLEGFNLGRVFMGGSLGLGSGSDGFFSVGCNPQVGYKISENVETGFAFNFDYYTATTIVIDRDLNESIARERTFNYGAGVFARVYPFETVFLQIQPEYNWRSRRFLYERNGAKETIKNNSASFLAGIGYGDRSSDESASYFFMVMIDLGTERNTPYRDNLGRLIPVVRAGYNFYLFRNRRK